MARSRSKSNPTHSTRDARRSQAQMSYSEALAAVHARPSCPATASATAGAGPASDPAPGPTMMGRLRFAFDYRVRTAMASPPEEIGGGSGTVFADNEQAVVAAAVDWVHDHDIVCDPRVEPLVEIVRIYEPERVCYHVESGGGQVLSDDLDDEDVARALARRLQARLVEVAYDTDGTVVEDQLVFDYGVDGA